MRKVSIILAICFMIVISIFAWDTNSHVPIRVFRAAGEVPLGGTRIYADTLRATSSSGMVIDISAAGFSTIPRVQILPMRNTASAMSTPNVSVKSITTTAITINICEGNSAVVNILGINVLSGAPVIFVANPTDILLNVQAVGN